jgi:ribosome-associated protein
LSLTSTQFRKLAVLAARRADQKKAEEIALLDLRHTQLGLCDFALLMSATSEAHISALYDDLQKTLESIGLYRIHRDGGSGGHWVILDYGGLIIHIFHHASRAFYTLERLWESARPVAWEDPLQKKPVPAKKKPVQRKKRRK